MPVVEGGAEFEKLTRRHAIKIVPTVICSVEEASLAVGAVVGYDSIKSASRMNGAIVIFLDNTAKANAVVEAGVVIQDTFIPVLPLVSPAKRVTISNAPPFFKNDMFAKELSRYGQLVSPIKMVSLGCKNPLLKHVVCHRRQVLMVLKDNTKDLNLSFNFKVDGFSYMVFATSDTMKCFGCGMEGHLIRSCPQRRGEQPAAAAPTGGAPGPDPGEGRSEESERTEEQRQTQDSEQVEEEKEPDNDNDEGEQAEKEDSSDVKGGEAENEDSSMIVEDEQEENDSDDPSVSEDSQKRKRSQSIPDSLKVSKVTEEKKIKKSSEELESDFSLTQEDQQEQYTPVRIQKFLQGTKGFRKVKVQEYFPDLQLFVKSARPLVQKRSGNFEEDVLSDQEIFRLKKLILKVRAQLDDDDDEC